jgi:hypothetical protein
MLILAVVGAFSLVGCASGRMRGDGETRSRRPTATAERVPSRQSSYRIRGTDEVGVLNEAQKARLRVKTRAWRWPMEWVTVTSNFGHRKGSNHDGVDLRASSGTPVYAAADGKVIYAASRIRGYGRMVVLRHDGKLSTIYAHNSQLRVKAGQRVRRGQLIALSGNSGHSTGPHVHFEVREGVTAINPLILLPSPAVANEATRRIASANDGKPKFRTSTSSARRSARPHAKSTSKQRYSSSSAVRGRPAARVAQGDGFRPKSPRAKTYGR